MSKQYLLGAGSGNDSYYVAGIDIKEKYGPLPLYGWAGLVVGGYLVHRMMKHRR